MINPGDNSYEVVLDNNYYLRELVESITLEDSLDEISLRASVRLVVTDDFQQIGISPGQEIRISGIPFGGTGMVYLLQPGVVWDCSSTSRGQKHIDITIYDKTIYLSKSEDEYLFPAGQTATQRLKKIASDWGIGLSALPDSGVGLAKAVYRAQAIYSMILSDLKETVSKGGDMFRPRMTPDGLELYKLGSNENVWALETDQNVEEITQHRTLDDAVTRVKVLGNAADGARSPVLAVVNGEPDMYGTLQRVLSDSKVTDSASAKTAAGKILAGESEKFSVTCVDINTVRAGDKMLLNGIDLLITSVRHEMGQPGRMSVELASEDTVRRRYYG